MLTRKFLNAGPQFIEVCLCGGCKALRMLRRRITSSCNEQGVWMALAQHASATSK